MDNGIIINVPYKSAQGVRASIVYQNAKRGIWQNKKGVEIELNKINDHYKEQIVAFCVQRGYCNPFEVYSKILTNTGG